MTDTGPPAETALLTVTEVADMMRVSKMTIYRLCHTGALPYVQVGRSMRIPATAAEAVITPSVITPDVITPPRAVER